MKFECCIIIFDGNLFLDIIRPWIRVHVPWAWTYCAISITVHYTAAFFVITDWASEMTSTLVWLLFVTSAITAFSNVTSIISFEEFSTVCCQYVVLIFVDLFRILCYLNNIILDCRYVLRCSKNGTLRFYWEFFYSLPLLNDLSWFFGADTRFIRLFDVLSQLPVGLVSKIEKTDGILIVGFLPYSRVIEFEMMWHFQSSLFNSIQSQGFLSITECEHWQETIFDIRGEHILNVLENVLSRRC